MKLDKNFYHAFVLKMLNHSNSIAVFMILVGIYVCFSSHQWMFVIILGLSSVYLGWLTCQYVICESKNKIKACDRQYGCQIASFNSRLSIVSNATVSLFGLAFTGLIANYLLNPTIVANDEVHVVSSPYIVGFFKMMMMYILSDKIHTSQLLASILYRYSQSIKFLNIDIDLKRPDFRYPIIFLDGSKISDSRYYVTGYEEMVNVVFDPPLSLNDNSVIEYAFIEETEQCVVHNEPLYDTYSKPTCLFRCHIVIKKYGEPTLANIQQSPCH